MSDKIPLRGVALISVLLGITGALALIAGNYMMMYVPLDGSEYSLKKLAEIKSSGDIYMGMAVIATMGPLVFAGLYAIYIGLRPGGLWFALPPVLFYFYSLALVLVYEVASGLIILTYQVTDAKLPSAYSDIYGLLVGNAFGVSFAGSILLLISLWWKKTYYPKWAGLGNPLYSTIIITFILAAKPPEWTGWLFPNRVIIPLLIFLLISFAVFSGNKWLAEETPANAKEAS